MHLHAQLIMDPSEFNKPECIYNQETGQCPQEDLNNGCAKKFSYCMNGWTCNYFCKDDLVYNSKSKRCQSLQSCHKSMLEGEL